MMHSRILLLAALLVAFAARAQSVKPDVMRLGAEVYERRCAMCHENPQGRIPSRASITITKSADFVLRTLNAGVMQQQAVGLSASEREAVASYLTGRPTGAGASVDINANQCPRAAPPLALEASSWNGWDGGRGDNLRYRTDSGLSRADIDKLKLKWVFAYPGGASGLPAILGGRVFVPSMGGVVFSLDAATGCTYWARDVGAPVRSALSVGKLPSGKFVAYFGDMHGDVHALAADTGEPFWRTRINEHPMTRLTGSITLFEGRLYAPVSSFEERAALDANYPCCTFRGSVVALDAATGQILWKTYSIDEPAKTLPDGRRQGPAGGAIWSAPTIDAKRGVIYVGTGNGYTEPAAPTTNSIMALDLKTGAKRWVRQFYPNDVYVGNCQEQRNINCPDAVGPDFDFGSSPLLVKPLDGMQRLVVTSKSGVVFGLDPDAQGKILWRAAAGRGGTLGGIEWGGASDGDHIYVPVTDLIGRPRDDAGKNPPPLPGLDALSVTTGKLVWRTAAPDPVCTWGAPCEAALHAAPAVIPGVVFSGAFDGHERAYATEDGRVLWDFDTGLSFDAVNGGKANGGSIDQGGQAIAGGRLFVNSGGRNGYAGNALLAFTVNGK